jgi:hypothetical protein
LTAGNLVWQPCFTATGTWSGGRACADAIEEGSMLETRMNSALMIVFMVNRFSKPPTAVKRLAVRPG